MSDFWVAGEDVYSLMRHFVANYHPNLASVDSDIAIIFRGKAAKRGGQVILGVSRKSPAILDILGKETYKFILEIAADEWKTLSNSQQGALMDHLLCACRVEEDEESGELKCSIASPDVQFFWDELTRQGDWRPRPQQESGASMDVEKVIGGKSAAERRAPESDSDPDSDSENLDEA